MLVPQLRIPYQHQFLSLYEEDHHLSTCTTCQRILKEIPRLERFVLQDIKTEPIIPKQLDAMRELAGSYEALFSRRALKFRAMGLHEKQLAETDYRKSILQEYTFLKRPATRSMASSSWAMRRRWWPQRWQPPVEPLLRNGYWCQEGPSA